MQRSSRRFLLVCGFITIRSCRMSIMYNPPRVKKVNAMELIKVQGYPQEWFPSVSATIGDRYPERSFFQVFIAITSGTSSYRLFDERLKISAGPRFALVFLWYLLTAKSNSMLPKFVAGTGIFRTLTCGGWTYVTSTDDHNWHDIFMISYLVATLPWTVGCVALSAPKSRAIMYRKRLAYCFFGTLVPLIYFFIQHKVHKVPGGQYFAPTYHLLLNHNKPIQSTLSSNGRSSCSTSRSMLVQLLTLSLSRLS